MTLLSLLVLFNNLKSINFSGKLGMSKEFTMIGKSIALSFPNSLEYADISYLGDLHDSGNRIQTVMAEKRLIPQNKFDRTMQILKFLLKCL
jgi:hypothetical protein